MENSVASGPRKSQLERFIEKLKKPSTEGAQESECLACDRIGAIEAKLSKHFQTDEDPTFKNCCGTGVAWHRQRMPFSDMPDQPSSDKHLYCVAFVVDINWPHFCDTYAVPVEAALCRFGAVADGGENAFNRVGRADALLMLCGVVLEGHEFGSVFLQGQRNFGELWASSLDEQIEGHCLRKIFIAWDGVDLPNLIWKTMKYQRRSKR
jgi:hypothetical protein